MPRRMTAKNIKPFEKMQGRARKARARMKGKVLARNPGPLTRVAPRLAAKARSMTGKGRSKRTVLRR